MEAPRKRIKWQNKYLDEEKNILYKYERGEYTAEEAAYWLENLHQRQHGTYSPECFIENARWLGYRG